MPGFIHLAIIQSNERETTRLKRRHIYLGLSRPQTCFRCGQIRTSDLLMHRQDRFRSCRTNTELLKVDADFSESFVRWQRRMVGGTRTWGRNVFRKKTLAIAKVTVWVNLGATPDRTGQVPYSPRSRVTVRESPRKSFGGRRGFGRGTVYHCRAKRSARITLLGCSLMADNPMSGRSSIPPD